MKKFLLGFLVFLGFLMGMELVFRLSAALFHWSGSTISPEKTVTRHKLWQQHLFSNFLGVQQPDPYLLWKFKPYLYKQIFVTNSKGTLGPEFETEKAPGTFRILLLGDSSPVGLGLRTRKEAFGERFLDLLRENFPDNKFELINASVSGYTSAQGLIWFKRYGIKLKPDLLLVYFGNNDASYNGYLQDKQVLPKSLWIADLQNVLGNSAIYQSLRALLVPFKEKISSGKTRTEANLTVRVTAGDYHRNLQEILKVARKRGAKTMLVTVPVPREWPPAIEFKPFVSLKTAAGDLVMAEQSRNVLSAEFAYCLDWPEIKQKYPQIDYWTLNVLKQVYVDSGNPDSGIFKYQSRLANNPGDVSSLNNLSVLYWRKGNLIKSLQYITQGLGSDSANAILHYNLGMIEKRLGDTASAEAEFEKAKELDFYSLRTKKIYNSKIRELASVSNLPLIDLDSLFLANNNEFLFIDHCHPTAEGHRLVAQALLEKFKQIGLSKE